MTILVTLMLFIAGVGLAALFLRSSVQKGLAQVEEEIRSRRAGEGLYAPEAPPRPMDVSGESNVFTNCQFLSSPPQLTMMQAHLQQYAMMQNIAQQQQYMPFRMIHELMQQRQALAKEVIALHERKDGVRR